MKKRKSRPFTYEFYQLLEKEGLEGLNIDTYYFNSEDNINHNLILLKREKDNIDDYLMDIDYINNIWEELEEEEKEDYLEDLEEIKEELEKSKKEVVELKKDIHSDLDYLKTFIN